MMFQLNVHASMEPPCSFPAPKSAAPRSGSSSSFPEAPPQVNRVLALDFSHLLSLLCLDPPMKSPISLLFARSFCPLLILLPAPAPSVWTHSSRLCEGAEEAGGRRRKQEAGG
eukprot:3940948-Rhodomonas_salina.7